MRFELADCVRVAGILQLCVLIASALVPFRLNWKQDLACLPKLHRQMYWTYGGYVAMAIVAFGTISVANAEEIASGSGLARGFCGYVAVFWGIRISLQWVFDAKPFLTTWWLRAGYHTLTVLFATFAVVYGGIALRVWC